MHQQSYRLFWPCMTWLTFLIVCSLVAFACGARGSNWEDKRLVHVHAAAADMPEEWKGYVRIGNEPLGKGNYGEAWLARKNSSDQQVVVKFFFVTDPQTNTLLGFLSPSAATEYGIPLEGDLRDARNECETPRTIFQKTTFPEPNYVVDCIVNGVDDPERSYVVLELAGSQTLGHYMEDFHSQGPNDATRARIYKIVAKMLLEGLREFEGLYVHRDIKPANLMVSVGTTGEPKDLKFIDWGLAVPEGSTTYLGGDPEFMPPETVKFHNGENKAWGLNLAEKFTFTATYDVYAVGETLFSYVCNRPDSKSVTWRKRTYAEQLSKNYKFKPAWVKVNPKLKLDYDSDSNCDRDLKNDLKPLWDLIKVMRRPISTQSRYQKLRPLASEILESCAAVLDVDQKTGSERCLAS
mmetsp:Transcript_102238/g.197934  ORF Transcript_102238/g.197934 Transcript_102238/m.197934 type:complete len:408 (+) Transcript_102238:42-1265(+)